MRVDSLRKLCSPEEVFLRWKDMLSVRIFSKLQSLLVGDLTGQWGAAPEIRPLPLPW